MIFEALAYFWLGLNQTKILVIMLPFHGNQEGRKGKQLISMSWQGKKMCSQRVKLQDQTAELVSGKKIIKSNGQ